MNHTTKSLGTISIWCIPVSFLLAGTGMLILLKVVNAEGDFYTRIQSQSGAWILAHIVLLVGSVTLLPAAIGLRSLIEGRKPGLIATIMVPVIGASAILLAGQYAIDFLMPEIARLGGEARAIHQYLSNNELVNLLFYQLPNLSSLGLLVMSIVLMLDGRMPKMLIWVLSINWLIVILGNLVSTEVQRVALFCLGFTFFLVIRSIKD